MRPTATRGATHNYQAPENWDAEKDGECGDLQVRVQLYGARGIIDNVSTWKPNAAELSRLNLGGVIELSILSPTQPAVSLSVVDPAQGYVIDLKGPLTINEQAHGDDHGA